MTYNPKQFLYFSAILNDNVRLKSGKITFFLSFEDVLYYCVGFVGDFRESIKDKSFKHEIKILPGNLHEATQVRIIVELPGYGTPSWLKKQAEKAWARNQAGGDIILCEVVKGFTMDLSFLEQSWSGRTLEGIPA